MSAVKTSCFVAAFIWSCYKVWTFVSASSFDSLIDGSATVAELSVLVHVVVVFLGLALLVRIAVSWKHSHSFNALKASIHLFAHKEVVLVSTLAVLPSTTEQSVVTKTGEGMPIRSMVDPAMAIALVSRLLKRQELHKANPSPELHITEESAEAIHQLRRYAVEASSQGVVGSSLDNEELDLQLDNFISYEPAPLNVVESWEVVLRLYGYPRVESHRGVQIDFAKKRSVEVLSWLGMNVERPRRSAVRTALWDVEISDATFSTVMSDIRRGLSSVITERTRSEIFPPTFTDNIEIGVRLTTDFDLLRRALNEFRDNPSSHALLTHELRMIRDSPFAGVNYMWADLDGTTTRMVVLALDAAYELATWAQRVGDVETCMSAVKAGLRVMPGHEDLLEIQNSFVLKRSMSQGWQFRCSADALTRTVTVIPQQNENDMTLIRKAATDFDWPAWMAGRSVLDFPESWIDSVGEAAIKVEEYEDDDQLIVRAEAPGVNPEDDIEITITEGMLRIMVQRKKESKHEGKRHYRSEFAYGSFVRTIALPAGATDQDVKAWYADGVLEVRIPMSGKQAQTKKVVITRH